MSVPYQAHPTSVISEDAKIGQGTRIWHHAQIREGAIIGENCILGKGVYVGVDVRIGSGVKVQNGATIYRGVKIEDDVFIGPHVVFTNDRYPRAFSNQWEVVPTLVRRGASIGANSTIICGVKIGTYAMVGAGSVVTRNVPPQALVVGIPARMKSYVCRCGCPITATTEGDRDISLTCSRCGQANLIPPKA